MPKTSLREFIRQSRRRLRILLAMGVLMLVSGLAVWFWRPPQHDYTLRLSGGVRGLNRDGIASYLSRHARESGLDLEIVGSEGTIDATRLLQQGEIDMAIVNGLLRSPQIDSVRQVAPITVESLHLLVKEEYADLVSADLTQLTQLKLYTGAVGSEADLISRAVLSFCEGAIRPQDETQSQEVRWNNIEQLLAELEKLQRTEPTQAEHVRASLPDAVIHLSTLPSPLARKLIRWAGFRLLPIPFADAFSRITVEEEELDRDHLDQLHVVPNVIPAFIYQVGPPIPAQDCPTLGCVSILIVRSDVAPDVVTRLLPHIYEGPVARLYNPPEINEVVPTYPWHDASIAYRDREKPLLRSDLAETVQRVFGAIAPLVGGCLALVGFYRWRQTLRFIEYFEQYDALDRQAKGLARGHLVNRVSETETDRLEKELTSLQQKAVSDFCHNYFYGDGVFRNLMHLLAETRHFLRASTGLHADEQTAIDSEEADSAEQQEADT